MRFSFASALVAVAALAHTAWAASAAIPTTSVAPVDGPANPITQPIGDKTLKAGEAFTITWYVDGVEMRCAAMRIAAGWR